MSEERGWALLNNAGQPLYPELKRLHGGACLSLSPFVLLLLNFFAWQVLLSRRKSRR
jgi:hypothetical protein